MTNEQILTIIAGLKSDRDEATGPALVAAQRLLGEAQTFGSVQVALLLAIQQEIDPIKGSPYPALNQVYQWLVDKVFDNLDDTLKMPEVLAWYIEQANYDGLVFAKIVETANEQYRARITPIVTALRSNDPQTVQQGLAEAQQFFDLPTYIGCSHSVLFLALKDILDREANLGEALVAQARQLLLTKLRYNWGFLNFDDVEISKLADWYRQQDDGQLLDR